MCILIVLLGAIPALLSAASYDIRLFVEGVTVSGDAVGVDVRTTALPGAFASQVDAGAVFSMNYHIEFRREKLFFDELVLSHRINRTIYRDFWDKRYIVEQTGGVRLFSSESLTEAISFLSSIGNVPLVSRRSIAKNARYYFRTRLTAQVIEAYPYFNIFFNFIAALRYKIDWRTSDRMTGRYLAE